MGDWQPIETAPRFHGKHLVGGMWAYETWHRFTLMEWVSPLGWYEAYSGKSAHYVTHWQPLPGAPKDEAIPMHECNDCGIMIEDHRPICTLCERWYEDCGLPLPAPPAAQPVQKEKA